MISLRAAPRLVAPRLVAPRLVAPRLVAPCLVAAVICASAAQGEQSSPERIEARAACITHEGGDVPVRTDGQKAAVAPSNKECGATVLDGTVCGSLEGAAERQCLVGEIAIWEGVLNRLVEISDKRDRQISLRGAISAFRSFRDKACATFQKISINTPGPTALAACRVSETARFAQELYVHFYSP